MFKGLFMRNIFTSVLVLIALCHISAPSFAQMVGSNVFVQGRYLEIGQNDLGAFGAHPVPAGYHPDAGGGYGDTVLAEVYDWGHNGWSIGAPGLMGDYTYAGNPYEGWGIQVGGPSGLNWALTNNSGITGPGSLTGHNVSYSNSGGKAVATWVGTTAGGQLAVNMRTTLDTNASWVIMKVILTNTGLTPLNNVYYFRGCDPDNDQAHGGGYTTNNYVDYQNDTAHRVLVSAHGQVYTFAYLGLGTKDSRAKALAYDNYPIDFYVTDLSTVYSGTAAIVPEYNTGINDAGDIGIGIVFNLGTIAAGDSAVFSYAYTFQNTATGIDSAFPSPNIYGPSSVCVGATITLTDAISGGVWSSGSPGIATIGSGSGIVSGISGGTAVISYSLPGPVVATYTVSVGATTPAAISGLGNVCTSFTVALSDATPGGIWSCSPSSVATVSPTGIVSGIAVGTANVTYAVTGCPVTKTIHVKGLQTPQICVVDVDSATGKNLVIWNQFAVNNIEQFHVYRENSSSVFVEIESQPSNAFSTYLDTGSYPVVQSYSYQLTALDSCGIETLLSSSTVHTTIHLSANLGVGGVVNLIWNTYVGAPVTTQNITRSVGGGPFVNIAAVANTVTSYTDVTPPAGTLEYRINSVMAVTCSPSFRTTSGEYIVSSNGALVPGTTGIKTFVPGVQVFPNPTTDQLIIKMEVLAYSMYSISNSIGQQLIQQPITGTQTKVDVSTRRKRIFFL